MSATLVTAAAAGWYHDPSDSGSWRWWDGATWTSHVRPKAETAPVAIAYPISEAIVLPVQPTAPVPVAAALQPVAQLPQTTQPAQLPQPAQPILPIQPLSLTPETPASEQEYWHSAAAEVVQIPGRSATSQHASGVGPGGHGLTPYSLAHEWGDVGSPNTAGIWLLAAWPLLSIAIGLTVATALGVIQGTTGAVISVPNIVFTAVSVIAGLVFAGIDIKTLGERGYRAPKIWWMFFLGPLAHFIVRGRAVRREGQRAWPPELLYFLSVIGIIAVAVIGVILLTSVMGGELPGLVR